MTRETSLNSELRHLLSNLSGHGGQHLTEIETDLVQTNFLLSEAIEKLSASFMAIHEAVSAQQQAVESILAGAAHVSDASETLRQRHAEIAQHVSAAVTGLQFQDMTSQLIGRTVRRVTGLRDVLSGVGSGSIAMPAEGEAENLINAINDINAEMEKQSVKLESELWKAVCQTHMESGDIELF
jgi:methyl-accepting chemotaxis protein